MISEQQNGRAWAGLIWLRIGLSRGGLLWTWTLRVPSNAGITWRAKELLPSQERLGSDTVVDFISSCSYDGSAVRYGNGAVETWLLVSECADMATSLPACNTVLPELPSYSRNCILLWSPKSNYRVILSETNPIRIFTPDFSKSISIFSN